MLSEFSLKWFTLYYAVFGTLCLIFGVWLLAAPSRFKNHLLARSESEDPPPLIRSVLKYWFLFTIPCLLLSFFPFSITELLFSVWSLLMVYVIGSQLVRWQQLREVIQNQSSKLNQFISLLGVAMVSAGIVTLLLGYLKLLLIL